MSSGERTIAVAEGMLLWARVQNLPGSMVDGSAEIEAWNHWVDRYGAEMAELAKSEQFRLFDVVNGKSWRY